MRLPRCDPEVSATELSPRSCALPVSAESSSGIDGWPLPVERPANCTLTSPSSTTSPAETSPDSSPSSPEDARHQHHRRLHLALLFSAFKADVAGDRLTTRERHLPFSHYFPLGKPLDEFPGIAPIDSPTNINPPRGVDSFKQRCLLFENGV